MKYTVSQENALSCRDKNLLIIACAGSGKTQVLSRRIALLVSEGVAKDSIVAFTFTDMAAGELKSRIRKELAQLKVDGKLDDASLGDMYVGTIHSFSLQLLKEIDPSYRNYDILDEERQAAIIVSHYKDFGLDVLQGQNSKIETIKRFIETLGIVYREDIDLDSLSNEDLVDAINRYKAFVTSKPQCFLSFDEIISELIRRLETNEAVQNRVQHQFTNIFVDEYQDVDDRQETLIRLLSNDGTIARVCAVGDDDQAIYRFRGASVENILTFEERYPDVEKVTLSDNFRSTHAIVEIANTAVTGLKIGRKVISGLSRRLQKTMKATHYDSTSDLFCETMAEYGDVWNCSFDTEENEAVFIADKIQELIGFPWQDGDVIRGLSLSDMAILCRSINHANAVMNELNRRNINYIVKGATGLFEHSEIRIVYGIFCLLSGSHFVEPNPERYNNFIFREETETRNLIRSLVESMNQNGKMPGADANLLFAWIAQKKNLFSHMKNPVQRERLNLGRRIYPQTLFYEMLEQLGANSNGVQWNDTILYNLGRFSELILSFEAIHQWVTPYDLGNFTYYLGYWVSKEADRVKHEDIGGQNAIQLTTVHQAKGLEWPVVFIPSLTNRRFPSSMRTRETPHLLENGECRGRPSASSNPVESKERLDEELRLWYVALTRSKKFLFLTSKVARGTKKSDFAVNIQHNYVCEDSSANFARPARIASTPPVNAEMLPTTFSDLRYYWECPYDYKLRRLMGFSPGVIESYGYGQQIHNLLALLHQRVNIESIDDAWIETQVENNFNLRYTRGAPLDAMKAAAKRILKTYLHDESDIENKVLSSEKPFEFIIGDAMISGTIDLINRVDNEQPDMVEIVDFKTGKSGDDIPKEERMELVTKQLLLYSIATEDAFGYNPKQAAAHFLYATKNHEKIYIELNDEEKDRTKKLIKNTVENIKGNRFPMCTYDVKKCGNCDFKSICCGSMR